MPGKIEWIHKWQKNTQKTREKTEFLYPEENLAHGNASGILVAILLWKANIERIKMAVHKNICSLYFMEASIGNN